MCLSLSIFFLKSSKTTPPANHLSGIIIVMYLGFSFFTCSKNLWYIGIAPNPFPLSFTLSWYGGFDIITSNFILKISSGSLRWISSYAYVSNSLSLFHCSLFAPQYLHFPFTQVWFILLYRMFPSASSKCVIEYGPFGYFEQ